MSPGPTVTVVMPCRNGARYLDRAIRSVLDQSLPDLELLVIDDGSTDGSRDIVAGHLDRDARVSLLRGPGLGAGPARNVGVRQARGRWVAYLDADDWWETGKLERQLDAMACENAAFSWTSFRVFDDRGRARREIAAGGPPSADAILEKRVIIGCSTVIFDRERLGMRSMPELRMRQDIALWLEIARACERERWPILSLPDVLTNYQLHGASLSASKLRAAYYQWRLYRDVERLGRVRSASLFFGYAVRSVVTRLR